MKLVHFKIYKTWFWATKSISQIKFETCLVQDIMYNLLYDNDEGSITLTDVIRDKIYEQHRFIKTKSLT